MAHCSPRELSAHDPVCAEHVVHPNVFADGLQQKPPRHAPAAQSACDVHGEPELLEMVLLADEPEEMPQAKSDVAPGK